MMGRTPILLVDDSPEIRLLLQHMLISWGYDVVTASSGDEAWAMIQQNHPRMVIADWMMPGLDGPGLCKKIRSSVFPAYIYVILLTARHDTESLVHGIEVGADDFVTKPANVDGYNELKARIRAGERIIQLWQALQEQNRRHRISGTEPGEQTDARSSHRFNGPHRPGQELARGPEHDPWRDHGRRGRQGRDRAGRYRAR